MKKLNPHTCILSQREIEKLLEPIEDHGHCYSAIAQSMIRAEKERRKFSCKQCIKGENYG